MKLEENSKEFWIAAKHKEKEIRENSRSGGVFTELANYVLARGGSVYGCQLNENFDAIHKRATTYKEVEKFRGSKYLQSDIRNIFDEVVKDLSNDKYVLFSGTPCQVSAIKNFIQMKIPSKSSKLILVDIVCHGVPSSRVWHDYLAYITRKKKKKIKKVEFRNKRVFGWADHVESFYFDDDSIYNSTYFRYLFYRHTILRPSCFNCKYKGYYESDITLGDAWGLTQKEKYFVDNVGVSLVIFRTDIAKVIFDNINEKYDIIYLKKNYHMQEPLNKACECPKNRNKFWKEYNQKSFKYILKKYASDSIKVRIKKRIKKFLNKGGIYEKYKVNKL